MHKNLPLKLTLFVQYNITVTDAVSNIARVKISELERDTVQNCVALQFTYPKTPIHLYYFFHYPSSDSIQFQVRNRSKEIKPDEHRRWSCRSMDEHRQGHLEATMVHTQSSPYFTASVKNINAIHGMYTSSMTRQETPSMQIKAP
eukprot:g8237.t1